MGFSTIFLATAGSLLVLGSCQGSVIPLAGVSASQFRYQDELGQHAFGHVGGPNSREEVKTADGITRGSYSYVDGNGLIQSAAYVADDVNGFRVRTSNLAAVPVVAAPAPLIATGHALLAAPAVLAGPTFVASPAAVAAAPAAEAQPSPSTEASSEAPATEAPSSTPETSSPTPEQPAESSPQPEPAPASVNPYEPVQDTPEVVAARAQHLAAVEETKARDAATGTTEESSEPTETPETPLPVEEPSSTPAAQEASSTTEAPATPALIPAALPAVRLPAPTLIAAPLPPVAAVAGPGLARVAAVAAPSVAPLAVAAVPVPAVADAAQYRYQDELGQWAFGHVGGPNAREEVKTADGITRGGYSYIDGNGLVQNAAYVADPLNGFRVAASNLPVQPAPQYIADSPEVQEAKEELFRRQEEHARKLKEASAQ